MIDYHFCLPLQEVVEASGDEHPSVTLFLVSGLELSGRLREHRKGMIKIEVSYFRRPGEGASGTNGGVYVVAPEHVAAVHGNS